MKVFLEATVEQGEWRSNDRGASATFPPNLGRDGKSRTPHHPRIFPKSRSCSVLSSYEFHPFFPFPHSPFHFPSSCQDSSCREGIPRCPTLSSPHPKTANANAPTPPDPAKPHGHPHPHPHPKPPPHSKADVPKQTQKAKESQKDHAMRSSRATPRTVRRVVELTIWI